MSQQTSACEECGAELQPSQYGPQIRDGELPVQREDNLACRNYPKCSVAEKEVSSIDRENEIHLAHFPNDRLWVAAYTEIVDDEYRLPSGTPEAGQEAAFKKFAEEVARKERIEASNVPSITQVKRTLKNSESAIVFTPNKTAERVMALILAIERRL